MEEEKINSNFFRISTIDKHVVFIHSNYFQKMINLPSHVKLTHLESCGSQISLCQQRRCNTTLAIYVDITNIDDVTFTPKNIDSKYYDDVKSFLTIELYKDRAEIYNACTDKYARRRGMMKTILKSVVKDIPRNIVWLGVDLRNKLWPVLTHLYVSVGFFPDGIQEITESGFYPKFPFISFRYDKSEGIPGERTKKQIKWIENKVKLMANQYINNQGRCQMIVHITDDLMETVYDKYITKDVEYGGIMGVQKVEGNEYLLGLAAVTRGSEKNFSVKTPNYYITWHTHPFICYKKNLCYIGWPSGSDMANRIRAYYKNGEIAHVLFANEGVYVLQLSSYMMSFIRAMEPYCVDNLYKLVRYYYEDLEHFREAKFDAERVRCLNQTSDVRCLSYDTKQQHLSIKNIITITNTFTLADLLNISAPNSEIQMLINNTRQCLIKTSKLIKGRSNVPIFRVQYTKKEKALTNGIKTRLEFFIAPENSACPVPIYRKPDIDFGIVKMEIEEEDDFLVNVGTMGHIDHGKTVYSQIPEEMELETTEDYTGTLKMKLE